jgi:hypothetical protein
MQSCKRCGECGEMKHLTEFNRSSKGNDGHQWKCRACYKAYNKSIYTYNMELSRSKHLKRTYGMAPEEYIALFDAQNGVCAACGRPETTNDPRTKQVKNLQIDHCHTTGEVIALLCKECKNALGLLHDDVERIRMLLSYAELHQLSDIGFQEGVET